MYGVQKINITLSKDAVKTAATINIFVRPQQSGDSSGKICDCFWIADTRDKFKHFVTR